MTSSIRLVLIMTFLFIATFVTSITTHASSSIVGVGSYHSMLPRGEKTIAMLKKQIRHECVVLRKAKLEKPIECLELQSRFLIQKICSATCSSGENLFLDGHGNELNTNLPYEI